MDVGTGNVDGVVVPDVSGDQALERGGVVGDSTRERGRLCIIGARNAHARDEALLSRCGAQALDDPVDAFVAQALVDDQAPRADQPPQPGRRIAGRRAGRYRPHLHAAEPDCRQDTTQPTVVVEAGGQHYGCSVAQAIKVSAGVDAAVTVREVDKATRWSVLAQPFAECDEHVVHGLRIETEEHWLQQLPVEQSHQSPSKHRVERRAGHQGPRMIEKSTAIRTRKIPMPRTIRRV
jgi:hypothetical protein